MNTENKKTNLSPYNATIGYQLSKILKLKRRLTDQKMQSLNLSRTQWLTLVWIQIIGSPCWQKDLLANLEIDAAHLTRILAELESRNYIQRTIVDKNRRCLLIDFTDYYIKEIEPFITNIIETENNILLSNLNDDDKTHLIKLLNQLEQNISNALHSTLNTKELT